jgi:hypothetical protein
VSHLHQLIFTASFSAKRLVFVLVPAAVEKSLKQVQ